MTVDKRSNVEKARAAWGNSAPEWVIVLAEACDLRGSSQTEVGKRIGITNSAVSQVLSNAYIGRLDRIEQRVKGELMKQCVTCPVLGEITSRRCMDEQKRAYVPTNAVRRELHKACPRCPNYRGKDS